MISFGINIVIALLWLLLSPDPDLGSLVSGYIAGFLLIMAFRGLLGSENYIRRSLAFYRFVLLFIREVILSSITLAKAVLLTPVKDFYPDFITLDVSGLSKGEILVLSHCITLTPGTTTVDISKDFAQLTVHAFDARDPASVCDSINSRLRAPLLAFTRSCPSS